MAFHRCLGQQGMEFLLDIIMVMYSAINIKFRKPMDWSDFRDRLHTVWMEAEIPREKYILF